MKKILAILLAAVMTLAACGAALADPATARNDAAVTSDSESIRFVKEITAYNPENSTVKEPTATYTYEIKAGTASKTIKDSDGRIASTKAGVGIDKIKMSSQTSPTAATSSTVSLTYAPGSGTTLTATSAGYGNTKWVEIDFSAVVFGAAGVYRYKIEERGYTYSSNGVTEGTTGHDRYLDVYVKDAATQSTDRDQPSDWDVYGYALFTTDDNIDANTDPKETRKTTGFATHYDGDPTDETKKKTADAYYTYNLTLQKTVVNDSYIKTTKHQFPFTLTLSNATVDKKVLPVMTVSENATQAALDADGIVIGTSTVWTPTIADTATVSYVGIPTGTQVTIKETNDVAGATYQVSITGADVNPTAANVVTGQDSGVATVTGGTAGQAASANKTVVVSNNLQSISPTGYVARYAPYALILAAGIALLLLAKKHKKHTDEE